MKQRIIKYLKENKIEFYMCRICSEIVDKNHFFTEEHIKKFNSVCKIKIEESLEKSFFKIKCKFLDIRYNYIYTDLYFKKYIRDLILENINTTKYYKSYIIKKICWNLIILKETQCIFQKNMIQMIFYMILKI